MTGTAHTCAGNDAERAAMKSFWAEHSKTATVEEMMLDSKAATIDAEERPEVRRGVGWGVVVGLPWLKAGEAAAGPARAAVTKGIARA